MRPIALLGLMASTLTVTYQFSPFPNLFAKQDFLDSFVDGNFQLDQKPAGASSPLKAATKKAGTSQPRKAEAPPASSSFGLPAAPQNHFQALSDFVDSLIEKIVDKKLKPFREELIATTKKIIAQHDEVKKAAKKSGKVNQNTLNSFFHYLVAHYNPAESGDADCASTAKGGLPQTEVKSHKKGRHQATPGAEATASVVGLEQS